MRQPKSMTALVSAFSRAYHFKNNTVRIFEDSIAEKLLSQAEYQQIADHMSRGISFFNPSFSGSKEEALKWITDQYLSPSPLGRAAFAETALKNAVRIGAKQYLIFGAGYDSFAYRQPEWASHIQIFELDRFILLQDKQRRLKSNQIAMPGNVYYLETDFAQKQWQKKIINHPAFDAAKNSFCSLLGLVYYLTKQEFVNLLLAISAFVPKGSSVVFDYPDEHSCTDAAGVRAKKQAILASGAQEKMCAGYSYVELEKMLSDVGFLIYEHLTPAQITEQYFENYNKANPEARMTAFDHVNYCLAVKQ
ncbi:MAG: class I SAM-dependent methyltransferase [Clostridiales bacterium]|nr:class I SAM-dependent methyltransferase [Clostridiales bacterium]